MANNDLISNAVASPLAPAPSIQALAPDSHRQEAEKQVRRRGNHPDDNDDDDSATDLYEKSLHQLDRLA